MNLRSFSLVIGVVASLAIAPMACNGASGGSSSSTSSTALGGGGGTGGSGSCVMTCTEKLGSDEAICGSATVAQKLYGDVETCVLASCPGECASVLDGTRAIETDDASDPCQPCVRKNCSIDYQQCQFGSDSCDVSCGKAITEGKLVCMAGGSGELAFKNLRGCVEAACNDDDVCGTWDHGGPPVKLDSNPACVPCVMKHCAGALEDCQDN